MADKLHLRKDMRNSYLIQRLGQPVGHNIPFSFGGGLANGGLSNEAMDFLQEIFSFDYMGAAEFEWGAVPASLTFIAEQAAEGQVVTGEHHGVYYLSPASYEVGVKSVVDQLIENEYTMRLKERCGLAETLKARESQKDPRIAGWLELNNGFFLFVDLEMFDKTKLLFGIE